MRQLGLERLVPKFDVLSLSLIGFRLKERFTSAVRAVLSLLLFADVPFEEMQHNLREVAMVLELMPDEHLAEWSKARHFLLLLVSSKPPYKERSALYNLLCQAVTDRHKPGVKRMAMTIAQTDIAKGRLGGRLDKETISVQQSQRGDLKMSSGTGLEYTVPSYPHEQWVPTNAKQGDSWFHPKTGIELVFIPPGEFLMGDDPTNDDDLDDDELDDDELDDDELSDNPRHTVNLSGYWISRTVVTVEQYMQFCDQGGRKPDAPDFNPNWSKRDHPIVNVSWNDAQAYCNWAGLMLPTEAQWEKAARGTDGRKFPWGDTFDASKCHCSKSSLGDAMSTAPVTQFRQGPYDLYDVAGNVSQWCRDAYVSDFYTRKPLGETEMVNDGTKSIIHVLRGCSWFTNDPEFFRATKQLFMDPEFSDDKRGFRVVLDA